MKYTLLGNMVIAGAAFIYFLIQNLIDGVKYSHYIKEKHPDKWLELTTSKYLGGPVATGKGGKFFWSEEDWGDKQITLMKNGLKKNMMYLFTSMGAFFVVAFMLYLLTDFFEA